jgi:primosomal protein N' (replication factor Y)
VISDQLALETGAPVRRRRPAASSTVPLAQHLPVAQVRVESPLPHLDRLFDYGVPASLDDAAQPGVRVRVRFAGRLLNGFIVGRASESSVDATLRPLERVLSAEPVLTPEVSELISIVADRYAGTFWDVLRAAIPPRHARAEASEPLRDAAPIPARPDDESAWARYTKGRILYGRALDGTIAGVRGVWSAAPAHPWTADIAAVARAVLSRPTGGVLIVVPDAWDVAQVVEQLDDCAGTMAVLTADLGPERRYREFLKVLRGSARLVVGTRGAVFAPVHDLALVVIWNDGDEALWEPHAPYWNARDVAALRSHLTGCGLLVGSPARSVEAERWCASGWAQSITTSRQTVRDSAPIVRGLEVQDEARDEAAASARIPHTAWLVAKEGLRSGPVLVQVARRGYLPSLSCAGCREAARCSCGGPLTLASGQRVAVCGWCGALSGSWACPKCGAQRFRAVSVGVERTAEEFGRAFQGERIIWSAGEQMKRSVGPEPAVVVATAGAEPVADGGYAAVVILDARGSMMRQSLRSLEECAHRWFSAGMLARPRAHIIVTADTGAPPVQALVRWDASWLAARELADRESAGLPPATRVAILRGSIGDIEEVGRALTTPHRLLGPVARRAIVTVRREDGAALGRELRGIAAVRSARSGPGMPVTVTLDPRDLDV